MSPVIKHIVFDIGRVLLDYDPERAFVDLIPDYDERQWFLANVCTSKWNLEQDRGRPWGEAENLLIAKFPEHTANIRAYRQNWHHMISGPIKASVTIYEMLIQKGNDVTLLTNFASDTFKEAQERFTFLKASRGATVSGDLKLLKPDIKIYHHHARAFELDIKQTLFIDDSENNVAGAIDAGWHSILFTTPEKLLLDLRQFDIQK